MVKESTTLEDRLKTRMTDLLFRNVALSQSIVLINGLVVYLILYQYMPGHHLVSWLITLLFIALLRLSLARFYWKRRQGSKPLYGLLIMFFIATYLSALNWAVLILLVPGQVVWIEAFIAFVIAGMSAGSLITGSASLVVSIPYLVLILCTLPFHYAGIGDPPHLAMAVMVTLYMFMLIRLAFRVHDMQYTSLRTELENTDMFQVLKRSKQEADDMRLRLQREVENLPEELAQHDIFFELSPDLLAITDTNGRLHQANPSLRVAIGIQADGVETASLIDYFHADDIRDLKLKLAELIRDQDEVRCQLRLRYADGDYRPADFLIIYNKAYYYFAGREAATA